MQPRLSWQKHVIDWANKHKASSMADDFVEFFNRAFQVPYALYPKDAWFGAHSTHLSLTIGNIWLAAIGASSKRVDLLVDDDPSINGVKFIPAPSTQRYTPLGWLIVEPSDQIGLILQSKAGWKSYERACEKILDAPISRLIIQRNLHRKKTLAEWLAD